MFQSACFCIRVCHAHVYIHVFIDIHIHVYIFVVSLFSDFFHNLLFILYQDSRYSFRPLAKKRKIFSELLPLSPGSFRQKKKKHWLQKSSCKMLLQQTVQCTVGYVCSAVYSYVYNVVITGIKSLSLSVSLLAFISEAVSLCFL